MNERDGKGGTKKDTRRATYEEDFPASSIYSLETVSAAGGTALVRTRGQRTRPGSENKVSPFPSSFFGLSRSFLSDFRSSSFFLQSYFRSSSLFPFVLFPCVFFSFCLIFVQHLFFLLSHFRSSFLFIS